MADADLEDGCSEDFEREPANPLPLIQQWYARQCDGDWEHSWGLKIDTLDNPGWHVQVDLALTSLQPHSYPKISEDGDAQGRRKETRWIRCYREGYVWHGVGDPTKLNLIPLNFLHWAADVDPGWPTKPPRPPRLGVNRI